MIRFTWLRFRAQAAVVFGALAVLAVVLAVTGWHLARLYDTTAAACKARGDCAAAMNAFANDDRADGIPDGSNLAHELVADRQRRVNAFLGPFVPAIDVLVRAANAGHLDANEHIGRTDLGDRDFLKNEARLGRDLAQGVHGCGDHRGPYLRKTPGASPGRHCMLFS